MPRALAWGGGGARQRTQAGPAARRGRTASRSKLGPLQGRPGQCARTTWTADTNYDVRSDMSEDQRRPFASMHVACIWNNPALIFRSVEVLICDCSTYHLLHYGGCNREGPIGPAAWMIARALSRVVVQLPPPQPSLSMPHADCQHGPYNFSAQVVLSLRGCYVLHRRSTAELL